MAAQSGFNLGGRIVVGIDIGTTQSAVALTYLARGEKQEIHRIAKWPGQGEQAQRAKIPTVICFYQAESFGAKAMSRNGKDTAGDNGWFLTKHFKLHLQPQDQRKDNIKLDRFRGETDFSREADLGEVQAYNGGVIAHPNGWERQSKTFLGKQQFIPVSPIRTRQHVKFSFLSSILQASATNALNKFPWCSICGIQLQPGTNLASSSYAKSGFLTESQVKLNTDRRFTAAAVEDFENFAKRNYDGPANPPTGSETVFIQVANASFNRNSTTHIKIHRGRRRIPSLAIKKCFDVSVKPILSSVDEQLKDQTVQHVLLVGGFGDSPYLQNQFESHFSSDDRQVVLANESTSKAMAVGSVIWNTLGSVISRTPRRSFGIICAIPCLSWMETPGGEGRAAYIGPPGIPRIPGK
ncbi:hypothetical protein B0J17DRAFT_627950 [Rhizoctonia solani]|nr:hypothetical protein B0J17DRAFT_627950 [Rhizoctonia solani]